MFFFCRDVPKLHISFDCSPDMLSSWSTKCSGMATVWWICVSEGWHRFKCGWKAIQTEITVIIWIVWLWKCHRDWTNTEIIRKIQSATHHPAKKSGKSKAFTRSRYCKRHGFDDSRHLDKQKNGKYLIRFFLLCIDKTNSKGWISGYRSQSGNFRWLHFAIASYWKRHGIGHKHNSKAHIFDAWSTWNSKLMDRTWTTTFAR